MKRKMMRCWTRSPRTSRSEITMSLLQMMMRRTKMLRTKSQINKARTKTRMF